MSIFNQDIEKASSNAPLAPDSDFRKFWLSQVCREDAELKLSPYGDLYVRCENYFTLDSPDPIFKYIPHIKSIRLISNVLSYKGEKLSADILPTLWASKIMITAYQISNMELHSSSNIVLQGVESVSDSVFDTKDLLVHCKSVEQLPYMGNVGGSIKFITINYEDLCFGKKMNNLLRSTDYELSHALSEYIDNANIILNASVRYNLYDVIDTRQLPSIQGIFFMRAGTRNLIKFLKINTPACPYIEGRFPCTGDGWVAMMSRFK